MISIDRLLIQLNNTGLQNTDTPLYQFLNELIRSLKGIDTNVSKIPPSGGGSIVNITNINPMVQEGLDGEMFIIPGSTGIDGRQGIDGISGFFKGEDGLDADVLMIPGRDGTSGTSGTNGRDGISIHGDDGQDGNDGQPMPGIQGLQGVQGFPGSLLFLYDSLDGDVFPIPGSQGPAGNNGTIGRDGNIGPAGNDGEDGETTRIPGIPGPQGIAGPIGAMGAIIFLQDILEPDWYPIPGIQGLTGPAGAAASNGVGLLYLDDSFERDVILPRNSLGNGTDNRIPLWFAQALIDSIIIQSGNNIGTGGVPTAAVHIQSAADAGIQILASNTNGVGTTASGSFRSGADVATVSYISHGSGRVIARFGITLGAWNEMLVAGGNGLIIGSSGAVPIVFGTNNIEAFRINSAQDWLKSGNIMDSVGVPTISSGFGGGTPTIEGFDYGFVVTVTAAIPIGNTGVVNFGHTFNNRPSLVVSVLNGLTRPITFSAISTTSVTIAIGTGWSTGDQIHVQTQGF